jgi:hypothetical protein
VCAKKGCQGRGSQLIVLDGAHRDSNDLAEWDDLRWTVNIMLDRLEGAEALPNQSTKPFDNHCGMIRRNRKEIARFAI